MIKTSVAAVVGFQYCRLLGESRSRQPRVDGQFACGSLLFHQRAHDPQPAGVGNSPEELCSPLG
jgi:hypothetical protein